MGVKDAGAQGVGTWVKNGPRKCHHSCRSHRLLISWQLELCPFLCPQVCLSPQLQDISDAPCNPSYKWQRADCSVAFYLLPCKAFDFFFLIYLLHYIFSLSQVTKFECLNISPSSSQKEHRAAANTVINLSIATGDKLQCNIAIKYDSQARKRTQWRFINRRILKYSQQ